MIQIVYLILKKKNYNKLVYLNWNSNIKENYWYCKFVMLDLHGLEWENKWCAEFWHSFYNKLMTNKAIYYFSGCSYRKKH